MTKFDFDDVSPFRTSCNKEDAVAKLLGLLQGHICQDLTESEHGYSLEQLKYMNTLEHTLSKHLTDLRNHALCIAAYFLTENSSESITHQALNELYEIENMMKKANLLLIEIEDELSRGEYSVLKVDAESTAKNGEIHITLKSLDTWGRKNISNQF